MLRTVAELASLIHGEVLGDGSILVADEIGRAHV